MCGIFFDSKFEQNNSCLNQLLSILSHRGPDHGGSFFLHGMAFLHSRLSILGLGEQANQPFIFEDLVILFNGEIFNYIELKEELVASGYSFSTSSDTEVLLKLFHRDGVGFESSLNGMWAFLIYNKKTFELYLSRDRFGQKPLFFTIQNERIVVSSEIEPILRSINYSINTDAIASFIREGDFDSHYQTFLSDVFEFPVASYCKVSLGKLNEVEDVSFIRYWNYLNKNITAPTDKNTFSEVLEDAVALRLRSEVPFCVLLSGGVDSTAVSSIVKNLIATPIMAYCYASEDQRDESKIAGAIAQRLGFDISTIRVEASSFVSNVERLVLRLGRGHSSPAIVPVDLIYRKVREDGFKVALDGQGADELLAGYAHFHIPLIIDSLKRFEFKYALGVLEDLFRSKTSAVIIMYMRSIAPSWFRKMLRRLYGYERLLLAKDKPLVHRLCISGELVEFKGIKSYLHKQHTVGLKNLLYYGDIVSMNNSVENRSPFMDHRLVELVFSTKDLTWFYGEFGNKNVLKAMPFYQEFREELDREKVGFNTNITFQDKKEMIDKIFVHDSIFRIIDYSKFRKLVDDGRIYQDKFERLLFRIFQASYWLYINAK